MRLNYREWLKAERKLSRYDFDFLFMTKMINRKKTEAKEEKKVLMWS